MSRFESSRWMAARLWLALLAVRLVSGGQASGSVVVLTDRNFDALVNTTDWMINVHAPWCPACKQMAPAWEQLAAELADDGIHVGKIDGTKEQGLVHRFSVHHYPSIFHIHGAGRETREYSGGASMQKMAAFARGGWRAVPPRSRCSSPVSRCGRALGAFTGLPSRAKAAYFEARERGRYSDVVLVGMLLAVPVALGLLCICVLDVYYTRNLDSPAAAHEHQLSSTTKVLAACLQSTANPTTPGEDEPGLPGSHHDETERPPAAAQQQPVPRPRLSKRRKLRRADETWAPAPSAAELPQYQPREYFRFEVVHQSAKSAARVGRIFTPHGVIDTPGFVAVGTNAALKAVDITAADGEGLQLVFANTYHLMLHPGAEVVQAAGGLHAFMGRRRDRPLITDSGGFQVFSMAHGTVHEDLASLKRATGGGGRRNGNLLLGVDEGGVAFRSYRDGARMVLTPESSVAAQKALGADIILPLDELPPYQMDEQALAASVERSHRWEARCLRAHLADPRQQAMYGIVHGGSSPELRRASAEYIGGLPFDGVAVGGALGRDRAELAEVMAWTMQWVPRAKPCHVLGIADPLSVPVLAALGCDTFDSCHATRAGRHGTMLTARGPLRVVASANKSHHGTPVEGCDCYTCRTHSLAYLHHLIKAKEPLAASLLSIHNIRFMVDLMADLRRQILEGRL